EFVAKQATVDDVRVLTGLDHELVETGRAGKEDAGMFAELIGRIGGLGKILLCQLLEPHLAIDRHEDVDHERDQGLVGANVRRRPDSEVRRCRAKRLRQWRRPEALRVCGRYRRWQRRLLSSRRNWVTE